MTNNRNVFITYLECMQFFSRLSVHSLEALIRSYYRSLLEKQLPHEPSCLSVRWLVCHDFLKRKGGSYISNAHIGAPVRLYLLQSTLLDVVMINRYTCVYICVDLSTRLSLFPPPSRSLIIRNPCFVLINC